MDKPWKILFKVCSALAPFACLKVFRFTTGISWERNFIFLNSYQESSSIQKRSSLNAWRKHYQKIQRFFILVEISIYVKPLLTGKFLGEFRTHTHKNPSRTHSTQSRLLTPFTFSTILIKYLTPSFPLHDYTQLSLLSKELIKTLLFEIKYNDWNKPVLTQAKDETSLYPSPL